MKVKRLTKKQKLFWADLQGRVGEHVVKYGQPKEIAIVVGEELSCVNNNELNKRVDQYLNAIMDRNFPPVDVTSIMRSWLTFYCLSIDPNKLTTSQYRFNQRYRQYIRTNSKRFYNVEEYCSDNTLAQYISRRILK